MSSCNHRILELEIALEIRKALARKEINPSSSMSLLTRGMQLLQLRTELSGSDKKTILLKVLERISAGDDGILGTDDDILPAETVKTIQQLLQGNLIHEVVDVFSGLLKGNIEIDVPKAKGIISSCLVLGQLIKKIVLKYKRVPSKQKAKTKTLV